MENENKEKKEENTKLSYGDIKKEEKEIQR